MSRNGNELDEERTSEWIRFWSSSTASRSKQTADITCPKCFHVWAPKQSKDLTFPRSIKRKTPL